MIKITVIRQQRSILSPANMGKHGSFYCCQTMLVPVPKEGFSVPWAKRQFQHLRFLQMTNDMRANSTVNQPRSQITRANVTSPIDGLSAVSPPDRSSEHGSTDWFAEPDINH